jgi:hypothetical protein
MGGLEGAKELKSNPRHGGKSSTVSKVCSLFKTYLTLQTRRRPDGAACKTLKPKGTTSPDVSEYRKKTLYYYISALLPGYESKPVSFEGELCSVIRLAISLGAHLYTPCIKN